MTTHTVESSWEVRFFDRAGELTRTVELDYRPTGYGASKLAESGEYRYVTVEVLRIQRGGGHGLRIGDVDFDLKSHRLEVAR